MRTTKDTKKKEREEGEGGSCVRHGSSRRRGGSIPGRENHESYEFHESVDRWRWRELLAVISQECFLAPLVLCHW